ncbi:non-homologous end-joining DNA ligase [Mechercharimyces sp. CAU 1602]|uniref:non-homologous end-joining DNA ligase n=1 Tax=Mechercharimyces sp. CAU 1602 TaxID=2973933 RepID=UPI002162DB65|nr:non-homologous end-joining DNA ligase [Mechercharimyces sp. CAU 1602]MCS1351024.1 non-homologous end-joining DNA ligase [Mechercharimyces sp. CAU 1602]
MVDRQVKWVQVEGRAIRVSHPNKPIFPDVNLNKWEYLLHLLNLAPHLLSYTKARLLTVIRYPHGVPGESFYQKNAPSYLPDWIPTVDQNGTRYILLQDAPSLIWLGNQLCLEFHTGFHLYTDNRPQELVFDLDPSTEEWSDVQSVALHIYALLQELHLHSGVKTSGSRGLQIVIPLIPRYTYQQTRQVLSFIARYICERYPLLATIERAKKNRGGRVYIDYVQHGQGKSLISAYSPRARSEATISMPLTWEEVRAGRRPNEFTLMSLARWLEKRPDPLAPLYEDTNRQSIDSILRFLK